MMKTIACLIGLLLATGCLGRDPGGNVASAERQTNQLACFDGLFLTNAPLRYQDCHAFLVWLDHDSRLDDTEKRTVCSKLKAFLGRKTARPLASDCDLTGLAAPEAILRAYSVMLLGKLGTSQDISFLEECAGIDQAMLPDGLRYEVTRTECENSIKKIRERESTNKVPEDTARKLADPKR